MNISGPQKFMDITESVSKMKSIRKIINQKVSSNTENENAENDNLQYKYFTCPSIVDIKVIDSSETEERTQSSIFVKDLSFVILLDFIQRELS